METNVILVHGNATGDIMENAEEWDWAMLYTEECYFEGGYLITLLSNTPLVPKQVTDIIIKIYDSEAEIPVMGELGEPVFNGKLDPPIHMTTDSGFEFTFLGGMWGYDEDGEYYEE